MRLVPESHYKVLDYRILQSPSDLPGFLGERKNPGKSDATVNRMVLYYCTLVLHGIRGKAETPGKWDATVNRTTVNRMVTVYLK